MKLVEHILYEYRECINKYTTPQRKNIEEDSQIYQEEYIKDIEQYIDKLKEKILQHKTQNTKYVVDEKYFSKEFVNEKKELLADLKSEIIKCNSKHRKSSYYSSPSQKYVLVKDLWKGGISAEEDKSDERKEIEQRILSEIFSPVIGMKIDDACLYISQFSYTISEDTKEYNTLGYKTVHLNTVYGNKERFVDKLLFLGD